MTRPSTASTDLSIPVRLMPDPWFRATAYNRDIYSLVHSAPYREPREDERALGPFILPAFQRYSVWTREQQVELIESLWDNLPVGAYVYNSTIGEDHCDGWLLDGQQRVTAILAYVQGDFAVYGHRFIGLSAGEQRGFLMKPISALETNISDEAKCRKVYKRLAYGGTVHAPEQYASKA